MQSGVRRAGGRRSRPVRRASAGITPVRAGALLALLGALAGLYGLTASSAFSVGRTDISGAAWTSQDQILAALRLAPGQNLFGLNATELAARVTSLAAVRSARVTLALPDEVRVAVTEREALVVWQANGRRFLVDGTGLLFGELGASPPAAADRLPLVSDGRTAAAALGVGSTLDPVTLDAALRLGSLTPGDIGSAATGLAIRVDDRDGITVSAVPAAWTAVFGFYTPTLRTTDLIPGQVRLLRSLLHGREASVARVVLADAGSGTYVPVGPAAPTAAPAAGSTPSPTPSPRPTPRPTPKPSPSQRPTASPKPTAAP